THPPTETEIGTVHLSSSQRIYLHSPWRRPSKCCPHPLSNPLGLGQLPLLYSAMETARSLSDERARCFFNPTVTRTLRGPEKIRKEEVMACLFLLPSSPPNARGGKRKKSRWA
ncbi:hypothetical protein BHE74_00042977, partial [Ensete ventricosum]